MKLCVVSWFAVLLTAKVSFAAPEKSAPDSAALFEKTVRPILAENCFKCHSHAENKFKGGLALDSPASILKGGETGPAIVPSQPEKSLLLQAVRQSGELKMPPKGQLTSAQVAAIEQWIKAGAPMPATVSSVPNGHAKRTGKITDEDRAWWAFQPIRKTAPAKLADDAWSRNEIDRFILARIRKENLKPSTEAARVALIRRLSFDLVGLPPSPDEVETFVKDRSADAYETLVDRLLASPRYGERWARHWLDLVRYADSDGYRIDDFRPNAWRYRDYVIQSFNDDKPYDRFVQEQLAGDELFPGDPAALTATGYLRHWIYEYNLRDVRGQWTTILNDITDTTADVFLGLGLQCARCHDHKFDAISAQDFAALYGIFASTRTTMHRVNDPIAQHAFDPQLVELKRPIRRALAELWREQLTHWPAAILAARDKVHEPDPPKPAEKDKPAAPMLPPFAPGARSLEAESFRWLAALKSAKSKPTESLTPFTRLIPSPPIAGAATNADAIESKLWTDLTNERHASGERRSASAGRFRWFVEFTDTDPSGLITKGGDWFATDNFQQTSVTGEFAVSPNGSSILTAILPRSRSSHLISNKHGGTLRSPNFTLDMKFISVLAGGTNNARVRLVIENFVADGVLFTQVMPLLNEPRLRWITLTVREAWAGRRAYLEIIPRDEMPYPGKHPDARILNTDGRSGVAVRAVAFHDVAGAPELSSPLPEELWSAEASWSALTKQVTTLVGDAINAWADERCSDEQARFIDELLRAGVLLNEAPADHELARLVARYRELEAQIPVPTRVGGVTDEQSFDEHLFPRGNHRRAGATVPRRYLEVLGKSQSEITNVRFEISDRVGSGRRELADAIVDPRNPLTARVMVNRMWQHVFGVGLVKTVDNFGVLGEPPSHPELLDWLAAEFVQSGWSTKHMLRLMLTSRAFQLSTEASAAARERDPNNLLLSHASVRRLEAESLRDSLLLVAGRLDRTQGGLGVPLPLRTGFKDFENPLSGPPDGNGRRSLYLEARRNYPQHLLIAFDQPKPVLTVGERNVTNVPAQSLALLNDKFVSVQSGLLADRVRSLATPEDRIRALWSIAFSRLITEPEMARAIEFLKSQATVLGIAADGWQSEPTVWNELAHALVNTKEFLYLR